MSNYINFSKGLENHFETFMNKKINNDCFFEKFTGGTRRTPILEKILLSSNIETIISGKPKEGKGNCDEFDYETFFDLIRLAWQEWLEEHIKNIDRNDIKDKKDVTKNIVYMLKLIDEPLNVDIAVISQERTNDNLPGKLYELLTRGEYKSIIPINNKRKFNKEILDLRKNITNSTLQLFKMVSIKSTSITSASQVGDHQFIIATFDTNDKKYYFGIGGGYDYTKKKFFMYETDLHGLSKFNINSKKNHYIHCNGIKTLTGEYINTFFNNWKEFIVKGVFTNDRTFGNGIFYDNIDYETYVTKWPKIFCIKSQSKNCASFVDMVWNFAKGAETPPKNNLSINILPRIISTFYHTPNTGLYVPGSDVQNSMLKDKNPKYKIYKFTNKIIHKLLELKSKAYKLDVPLFKDDLIEWMKDTANEMNNNNKQDDEVKDDDIVMYNNVTDKEYEKMKKSVQKEIKKIVIEKQSRLFNNIFGRKKNDVNNNNKRKQETTTTTTTNFTNIMSNVNNDNNVNNNDNTINRLKNLRRQYKMSNNNNNQRGGSKTRKKKRGKRKTRRNNIKNK